MFQKEKRFDPSGHYSREVWCLKQNYLLLTPGLHFSGLLKWKVIAWCWFLSLLQAQAFPQGMHCTVINVFLIYSLFKRNRTQLIIWLLFSRFTDSDLWEMNGKLRFRLKATDGKPTSFSAKIKFTQIINSLRSKYLKAHYVIKASYVCC